MQSKEGYIKLTKAYFPKLTSSELEELYVGYCNNQKREEEYLIRHPLRHTKETTTIIYKPWNDFDIYSLWAHHPKEPLKSVELGHIFKGDFPCEGIKGVSFSHSVSTKITANIPKEGIKLTILSLDDVISRIKNIDWSKVKKEF